MLEGNPVLGLQVTHRLFGIDVTERLSAQIKLDRAVVQIGVAHQRLVQLGQQLMSCSTRTCVISSANDHQNRAVTPLKLATQG